MQKCSGNSTRPFARRSASGSTCWLQEMSSLPGATTWSWGRRALSRHRAWQLKTTKTRQRLPTRRGNKINIGRRPNGLAHLDAVDKGGRKGGLALNLSLVQLYPCQPSSLVSEKSRGTSLPVPSGRSRLRRSFLLVRNSFKVWVRRPEIGTSFKRWGRVLNVITHLLLTPRLGTPSPGSLVPMSRSCHSQGQGWHYCHCRNSLNIVCSYFSVS